MSHGGDFLEIWVLNTGFWCIIKFELTSTLAPKSLQMISAQGVGETVYVVKYNVLDTKGGGGGGWEGTLPYVLSLV